MNRRRVITLVFLSVVAVSLVGATVAMGQGIITGEPRLSVDAPDSTLTPGETTQLELQISNSGDVGLGSPEQRGVVTDARNVRVELEGDGPIEIETNRQAIGVVTENQPGTATFHVTVPEDAEPDEYELDVELRYAYSARVERGAGVMNDRRRTVTRSVDVEIADEPRFEITDVTTDAQIGDRGTMEATVENVGSQTARDVRLALESTSSRFLFGAGQTESARGGTLAPGDETTIRYDVSVDGEASVREFALDGTVQFTDPETPVSVVYHASWPDEDVIEGTVGDIGGKIDDAGYRASAMVLIGDAAAGAGYERSYLYGEWAGGDRGADESAGSEPGGTEGERDESASDD